ncbi:MAG: hypothetical protein MHMPM18_000872 [Marteilia pararefringens]
MSDIQESANTKTQNISRQSKVSLLQETNTKLIERLKLQEKELEDQRALRKKINELQMTNADHLKRIFDLKYEIKNQNDQLKEVIL